MRPATARPEAHPDGLEHSTARGDRPARGVCSAPPGHGDVPRGARGRPATAAQRAGLRGRRGGRSGPRATVGHARTLRGHALGSPARPGRSQRSGHRRAAQRLCSEHPRLRRHPPGDGDPPRPGAVAGGGIPRRSSRNRRRIADRGHAGRLRGRLPARQRGVPGPLCARLAHHRHLRRGGRGGARRPTAGAGCLAHGARAGHRGNPGERPHRDAGRHGQEPVDRPRGARRAAGRHAGRRRLHRLHPRAGGPARFRRRAGPRVRRPAAARGAGLAVGDRGQRLQAVPLRDRVAPR